MAITLTRTTDGTISNANANLNNNWTTLENEINDLPLADIAQGGATADDALIWTGSAWAPAKVTNARVAAGAAIAYAKLNLASSIVNADVAAAAAVAVSKLAAGTDGQLLKTVGTTPTWSKAVTQQRNTTAVGTGAATAETDLQTITIAANALAVGDIVRISAAFTSSGNASSRTFRLYFGATAICGPILAISVGSGATVVIQADVVVTGASTQEALASATHSAASVSFNGGTGTEITAPASAISGSIIVKTTGTTPNAADEITSELLVVEIIPA